MLTARIAGGTCCPKPVLVAVLRRDDAVCGHQHRTVKALKFLFLLPPRIAVISCEMRILFEERIIVCRQHFRVRININSRILCLLKEHFKVFQIVT